MGEGCILPATKYLTNREFTTPINLNRAAWVKEAP